MLSTFRLVVLLVLAWSGVLATEESPPEERESPSLRQPLPELAAPAAPEEPPEFSTEVPPPPPFVPAPDSAR